MTALLERSDTPISTGEEDVSQFIHGIRRYPLLSAQEERALAKNKLISRMADLEQEAKKYGTHLTLHGNFDEWVWESYALSGSAREWMEAYAADKGYRSLAEM